MEGIKTIGISICIALVITSIFSMLVPTSKLEKVLKLALSLFFIASIITPIATTPIKLNIDIKNPATPQSTYKLQSATNESFLSIAKTNLENSIQRVLLQKGIKTQKVIVAINKNKKDNISISKVIIYTANINQAELIGDVIQSEVGVEPIIIDSDKKRGENKDEAKAW